MKLNIRRAWANLLQAADTNKPQLLAGIGTGMLIVAVPLAVVATVQTCKKIEEKKKEIAHQIQQESEDLDTPVDIENIELKPVEVIKIAWKHYIPSTAAMVLGTVCNISSTKEGLARTAKMALAYQLSEAASNELRQATKEVVGDKKASEIERKVMKNRMEQLTDEDGHIINVYDTRDGSQLCFDYWSGRYFYSDVEYIKSQVNRVNETMLKDSMAFDGFATLNDIYMAIGLPKSGAGEDLVWRLTKEGLIELKSNSYFDVDGQPCWIMQFTKPPIHCPSWMMDRM